MHTRIYLLRARQKMKMIHRNHWSMAPEHFCFWEHFCCLLVCLYYIMHSHVYHTISYTFFLLIIEFLIYKRILMLITLSSRFKLFRKSIGFQYFYISILFYFDYLHIYKNWKQPKFENKPKLIFLHSDLVASHIDLLLNVKYIRRSIYIVWDFKTINVI